VRARIRGEALDRKQREERAGTSLARPSGAMSATHVEPSSASWGASPTNVARVPLCAARLVQQNRRKINELREGIDLATKSVVYGIPVPRALFPMASPWRR
jgi:hypothetical protein